MYVRTYTASLKPGVLPQMRALCQGFVLELGQHPGFRHFYLVVDARAHRMVQITCWNTETDLLAAEPTAARLEGAPWRLHLYAAGKAIGHFIATASDATPVLASAEVYRLHEIPQRLLPTNLQLAGTLTLARDRVVITRDVGHGEALPPGTYQIVVSTGGPAQASSEGSGN